jgi:multicomponent K+:H+ antiporter subunit E
MRKLFPHPVLTITLIFVWMLLANRLAVGSLVMAIILGTLIPLITAPYWPGRPKLKRPLGLLSYTVLVAWDVIIASFQVAKIIVFMPRDQIQSRFIPIPIELTTPEAITLLAGTITMTPGTLTADISSCGSVLLIHSLHAPDPDAIKEEIKSRYESRLKRIFG